MLGVQSHSTPFIGNAGTDWEVRYRGASAVKLKEHTEGSLDIHAVLCFSLILLVSALYVHFKTQLY